MCVISWNVSLFLQLNSNEGLKFKTFITQMKDFLVAVCNQRVKIFFRSCNDLKWIMVKSNHDDQDNVYKDENNQKHRIDDKVNNFRVNVKSIRQRHSLERWY